MNIIEKPHEFLSNVQLEFIKADYNSGTVIYNGCKDDEIVIVIIKHIPTFKINIDNYKNYKNVFNNDRYYKFNGFKETKEELTVIYPASYGDIRKYGKRKNRKILETSEQYKKIIYPKIVKQDLTWIHNIFNDKCEGSDVLYEDDYFVLLPDLKWDGTNLEMVYCLAIVKDGSIRSIRDLRQKDVPLLNHVNQKTLEVMNKIYKIPMDQIRSYFHYPPSFWHAHMHFNLISNRLGGSNVDISYTVNNVIQNLKICDDYYNKVDLEIIHIDENQD